MTKNIAVLFNEGHKEILDYIKYYYKLKGVFKEENLNLYTVFTDEYDYKTKKFNVYNIYENSIELIENSEDINFDLILHRNSHVDYTVKDIEDNYNLMNPTKFTMLASSKINSAKFLQKYSPITYHFSKIRNNKDLLEEFKTSSIVIKPEDGHGGTGVEKIKLEELKNNFENIYKEKTNYIAQEFIDMSDGIKGLVKGFHDLRYMIFGDTIDYPVLRYPKKGDFRSNYCSGGKKYFLKKEQVPEEITKKAQEIANELIKEFGIIFASIDLAQDKEKGLILVEINSSCGVLNIDSDGVENVDLHKRIAKFVKDFS
ncbi:MAG: ATP-grasp domain-containing protein [Candidatus Gracilibacteria bacterium]|nr:ATP-grasp domain-containing protein [Candidatus Gracilibacteria bacterium]